MRIYYPYKSDKPEKKYYIITNTNKKYILALLDMKTLQRTRTKNENSAI